MTAMADYQDEWLKRIEEQIGEIRTAVMPLMAISQRLEEHHEVLYGNGQPGVIKDVDRLKQDKRRSDDEQRKFFRLWVLIVICGAALGGSAPEIVRAAMQVFLK